jgi:hypothetical protein
VDAREIVVLGTLAVAMFNVGVIWLTQRVVYPVWALVGEHEWRAYHEAHKRRLPGTAFVPHGLGIVACPDGWTVGCCSDCSPRTGSGSHWSVRTAQ